MPLPEKDVTNHDKWEIYIKTSLFGGLATSPVPELIRLPPSAKDDIDDYVFKTVSYVLYNESYDDSNEGTQALELIVNKIMERQVQGIKIRADMYPHPGGLCVVINVAYNPAEAHKYYINRGKIKDEDKIRRRAIG